MRILVLLMSMAFYYSSVGQISYTGCGGVIAGPYPFTLTQTGTTNDGGVIRNTYSSPLPGPSCSAGVCSFQIIWSAANSRWELRFSNNGVSYDNLLYFNTAASVPNPPDLTLGTWTSGGLCGSPVTVLSGDVQDFASSLPVELVSFEAFSKGNKVTLVWETISEINNDLFVIEESRDGKVFKELGSVKGKGSTDERQRYVFDVNESVDNSSYFRLKQVDFDGAYVYSKLVKPNWVVEANSFGEFFPNPSKTKEVSLTCFSENEKLLIVEVCDLTGKLISSQTENIQRGVTTVRFNFSNLKSGMYLVRISDKNGVMESRRVHLE